MAKRFLLKNKHFYLYNKFWYLIGVLIFHSFTNEKANSAKIDRLFIWVFVFIDINAWFNEIRAGCLESVSPSLDFYCFLQQICERDACIMSTEKK